nr:lysine specific demethylase 8 [Hymenolepis microstoma]CUU99928.1 lysine specific demethylase 8 [Hymenolepis microstoma]
MTELSELYNKSKEIPRLLYKCFDSLPKVTDEIFVHACLTSLETNNSDFYELIEYVRERLNVGLWRDVPDFWREAYALLRLASVVSILRSSQANGLCEMKFLMWQLDDALIMGHSDKVHQILTRFATLANAFLFNYFPSEPFPNKYSDINTPSPDLPSLTFSGEIISELRRVHRPSLEEFTKILEEGIPVIVTGAMDHWPACNESSDRYWSPAYWSKISGHRTVPIEVGSAYTDESWGQCLLTVNDFFKTFILHHKDDQKPGYLAQHQILLQIPELGDDVDIPDYCFTGAPEDDSAGAQIDSNIWVGPRNTISPLHHDSDRSNVLCQLVGKKYVKLYTADQTEFIYPHMENSMLKNTSQIDVASFHPDFSRFPKFREARGYHGVLLAGEMLFIPPRAWHYIRSLTTSISMNFWWTVDASFIPIWPEFYNV